MSASLPYDVNFILFPALGGRLLDLPTPQSPIEERKQCASTLNNVLARLLHLGDKDIQTRCDWIVLSTPIKNPVHFCYTLMVFFGILWGS